MKSFVHITARSIEEALATLSEYPGKVMLNAGGTDLLGVLKDQFLPAETGAIVDIKKIAGLDYLKEEGGTLRIGALARLADIAKSAVVRERYGVLAEAAYAVATPQIRNVATIGGNLCQDVRCWYYRYPRHIGGPIPCTRKGGGACPAVKGDNRYHAVIGGGKCFAVCPSDCAVALAALDASIIIAGPEDERPMAVKDFYHPLGNGLAPGEMIKEISVPAAPRSARQNFLKFTLRRPVDFAIVSVASVISVADGVCTEARIALGAVAPGVLRPAVAEAFLNGRPIDHDTAVQAGELALAGARPLSGNAYKIEIAKTLVKRAILG